MRLRYVFLGLAVLVLIAAGVWFGVVRKPAAEPPDSPEPSDPPKSE